MYGNIIRFMDKEPSSINSKKASKLTRRRLMKMATAAGFPAATALSLTPEDVKASDSDQVTIAFDVTGEVKKQVPADWYDHVRRTKRVKSDIEQKFLDREGINSVGVRTGSDPHVIVRLDADNSKKEERRGELPEYQNDVYIDVMERGEPFNDLHNEGDDGSCPPHEMCDDQTADVSQLPGGVATSEPVIESIS
jgi:hypothetical protein